MKYISPKTPSEIIPVTFDFTSVITTVSAVVSLTVIVRAGADPDVAAMLQGAPQIQGPLVVQLIKNGVAGVTYELRCVVTGGDEKYELAAQMQVIS